MLPRGAAAQNLVITNARIIVATRAGHRAGSHRRQGRPNRIGRRGRASAAPNGATVIDGTGMTVIAGYIDDHRHIIQGRGAKYGPSG